MNFEAPPPSAQCFPVDSLPSELIAVIREVEITVQSPIAIIAASMLSTMSIASQGLCDVHMPTGSDVPTSVFMLTIADSGERKTSTDNLFTKPISDYQARMQKCARDSVFRLESQQFIWDTKHTEIKRQIKKAVRANIDMSPLLEEQEAHLKSKPVPPRNPKILYSDTTPEALLGNLASCWPFAALHSSEAMSVLNGRAMQQLGPLNELWDGNQAIRVDRRHAASFELTDARLTLSLMVQNQAFEQFCARKDNSAWESGFLARALVTRPASKQGQRSIHAEAITEPVFKALKSFHETTTRLLSQTQKRLEEQQPRTVLKFSSEANLKWMEYAQIFERKLGPGAYLSEIKGFGSKIMNNLTRIAGLFHSYTSEGDEIQKETLDSALQVMVWYVNQYAAIFSPKNEATIRTENAQILWEWLSGYQQKTGDTVLLVTHLYKFGPKKLRLKNEMQLAIKDLSSQFRIRHNSFQKPSTIELLFKDPGSFSSLQSVYLIPPGITGLSSKDFTDTRPAIYWSNINSSI